MSRNYARATSLTLALLTASGAAGSIVPSAVVATFGPKSQLAGGPGYSIESLDRPFRSLSGDWWTIRCVLDVLSDPNDEAVIVGNGSEARISAYESPINSGWGGNVSTSLQTRVSINDHGSYAFTGGYGSGGSLPAGYKLFIGSQWNSPSVAFATGDPIPALSGAAWRGFSAPTIDNLGRVGVAATLTAQPGFPSIPGSVDGAAFLHSGNTLVTRKGDPGTQPSGQVGTPGSWEAPNSLASPFGTDASGNNWFGVGAVNSPTTGHTELAAYNNHVVLQREEDSTQLGSPIQRFVYGTIQPDGSWFVRGFNADGNDWIVYGTDHINRSIVAKRGDQILAGGSEFWSDSIFAPTFFSFAADNEGNYIIGGVTNNPDISRNAVMVYNGTYEIIREGDQVDVDGDGVLDDAYIRIFANDDLFLTSTHCYFVASVENAAGTILGSALFSIRIPTPSSLGLLGLCMLASNWRSRRR